MNLKIIRYEIVFKLLKDLKNDHGGLKAGRNELKGSLNNIQH